MIEKIRLSLWDIFSFFLTGFLAMAITLAFFIGRGVYPIAKFLADLKDFPVAITLAAAPLAFTLIGMLIEPIANLLDRAAVDKVYRRFGPKARRRRSSEEEELLADEIHTKYLGSLNGRVKNPYHLCKEYVETKQLSTSFMVFLSRYGFYRNCTFLALLSIIPLSLLLRPWWVNVLGDLGLLFVAVIFKGRSEDYYSYMAPTVYRAFLIDKLNWKGAAQQSVQPDGPAGGGTAG
jgi:hypothetical protein